MYVSGVSFYCRCILKGFNCRFFVFLFKTNVPRASFRHKHQQLLENRFLEFFPFWFYRFNVTIFIFKDNLKKMWFFLSDSYKIEVMITSLIEMLELPNFDQITTSNIWFKSRDKNFLVTSLKLLPFLLKKIFDPLMHNVPKWSDTR